MDGYYSFCAGHVEAGESPQEAMVRELAEEIGVFARAEDLRLVHTQSINAEDGPRLHLYFEVTSWEGEPENKEPHKCDEVRWVEVTQLPINTIPYIQGVIHAVRERAGYSETGWATTSIAKDVVDREAAEYEE